MGDQLERGRRTFRKNQNEWPTHSFRALSKNRGHSSYRCARTGAEPPTVRVVFLPSSLIGN
jgi:hypothetical protein